MKTAKLKAKRERAWELDFLRGIAILSVVWDHVMYDLGYMFYYEWLFADAEGLVKAAEFARDYHDGFLRVLGWPIFVFIFFFVSGTCTAFSRNNFFRGLKLAVVAVLVSVVTYMLDKYMGMSGSFILLGVLHCLALCMLLYSLIAFLTNLVLKKCNPKSKRFIKAVIYFIIAVAVLVVNYMYNVTFYDLNVYHATIDADWEWAGLFIYVEEWWTADYFPLLPFFGFFMLGATLAPIAYPEKKSLMPKLDGKWNKIFTVPGRYSLYIYLALQVVAVAVLFVITWIVTGEMPFF